MSQIVVYLSIAKYHLVLTFSNAVVRRLIVRALASKQGRGLFCRYRHKKIYLKHRCRHCFFGLEPYFFRRLWYALRKEGVYNKINWFMIEITSVMLTKKKPNCLVFNQLYFPFKCFKNDSINDNIGFLNRYWWILTRVVRKIARACECILRYVTRQFFRKYR